MERGIEVAKGRCRIGIDPFDAVALEKSVGLEVDGAEAFGNVGFLLAAECRKEVGGKFAFQMQLVNASVDPVDDAFFPLHESVGLHAHAFVFFFQTDGVDFHRLGFDVKLCGEVEGVGRFFEDGNEAGKVVERDSCLLNLSV